MAFNRDNFYNRMTPTSSAQLTIYSYTTADDELDDVAVANYFVGAGVLNKGDLIQVVASNGVGLFQIVAVTAGDSEEATAVTVQKFAID